MKLHILGSSSAGNGYIIETNNSALFLECGVPFKELLKSMDFELEKLCGGVVSHCHGDHAKYINDYLTKGVKILNGIVEHHNSIKIVNQKKFYIGEFSIIPLLMVHDVECFGFIISHVEFGNLFFATDTSEIKYNIPGLNHLLIEVNYDQQTLDENQLDHKINHSLASRVEESHLSFEKAKEWINNIDVSKLENIVFIHLSSGNSDKNKYVYDVQNDTGVLCHVAKKGEVIHMNF